ncbi:hypothetical protein PMZ80_000560 [Knufia obscura]|uniref:Uncharacterized protein n=2 Tax=Knufia TaxID=430999 RepID=A0AAN8EQF1_9EURO|nr:hypothetical protein PMZ80_000560 [Knufia obscura]KAK5956513.1 hypothetical protein OHC33_001998 [Knufia fluminis]
MATLLRKSRSIISARADHNGHVNNEVQPPLPQRDSGAGLFQQFSSIRNRRRSRIDLTTAVESEQSAAARQQREEQLQKQHSLIQLRRRLVRKASTFNLHTRHRSSPQKDLEKYRRTETILQREQSAASDSEASQITTVPVRRYTLPAIYDEKPLPQPEPEPIDFLISKAQLEILKAQDELAARYPSYREKHYEGLGVWAKMATPGAEPPLPYEKLKQITVDACDKALNSTTSYDHSKTESWNTTIINTILSELVGETGATTSNGSSTSAPQSKFKFVVNSTIVQHKSSNVDETTGRGQGRRGMHSAAGAYWNNEKDGMWSFKYEAAEKMGLDVVVGIVWIWVG